jgi:hypothetical protein
MTLKNYRSDSSNTFEVIQKCLISHRARSINYEYGSDGCITALAFSLDIRGQLHAFRLPARVEKVERVLYGTHDLSPSKKEQAYRTAWANIRDWLTAQMALIDTQMVTPEEVLLPYMLTPEGTTFYEAIEGRGFLLDRGGDQPDNPVATLLPEHRPSDDPST